ncbi:unnamed protein product [Periconia digitata]|uniref:Uncharacterized protein n=1 Tax=Periconia digitata TaxID=1303443 RepID=A0A9W4UEE9_9PLEO|nr:unnamed protein product [Periconia digitata]
MRRTEFLHKIKSLFASEASLHDTFCALFCFDLLLVQCDIMPAVYNIASFVKTVPKNAVYSIRIFPNTVIDSKWSLDDPAHSDNCNDE